MASCRVNSCAPNINQMLTNTQPPAQGSRPSSCSPFQLGWGPLASLCRFSCGSGQKALAACSTPAAEYLIKMESLLTQEPGGKTKGPFKVGTGSVALVASATALLTGLWFQTPDGLVLWFSISTIYSPCQLLGQPVPPLTPT